MPEIKDPIDPQNDKRLENNTKTMAEYKENFPMLFDSIDDDDLGEILYTELYDGAQTKIILSKEGSLQIRGDIEFTQETIPYYIKFARNNFLDQQIIRPVVYSLYIKGKHSLYCPWGINSLLDHTGKENFIQLLEEADVYKSRFR